MAETPNFLAMIEDYRCINLSARGKQLKPATDLVVEEQRRSLVYVLDIFPGLYCQRMTPAGSQPRTTVSQSVLIVDFVPRISQHSIHHSDSRAMIDEQTRAQVSTAPRSSRPDNIENRTTNISRAPPVAAATSSRPDELESAMIVDEEWPPLGVMDRISHKAERNDQGDRKMLDSGVEKDAHAHSQSSRYHTEERSRGGARESRRPSNPVPASQGWWNIRRYRG